MLAAGVPGSTTPYYIFVIVILVILARVSWRTFANYRGLRFSLARTYSYTGVYVVIGVVFSGLSYFEGVPILLAIPEVVLAAAAALVSYRYIDIRISFWRIKGGDLYFRGGVLIYLIYLVALIIRLGLDVALVGPAAFAFGTSVSLTGDALYATMATDLLLTFGVGLLIGRGIRVVRRYGMIQRGQESVQEAPPREGSLMNLRPH